MMRVGFEGAVLVGGSSRRMGTPKAILEIDGVPLAERVARTLTDAGAVRVSFVGSSVEVPLASGRCQVPDRWPGEGPLGGLITALDAAEAPVVLVVAGDMPDVDDEELRRLLDAMGDADVAVSTVQGTDQPMHAAWRREIEPTLLSAFAAGERSIRSVLSHLEVVRVAVNHVASIDDLDTPHQLRVRRRRR